MSVTSYHYASSCVDAGGGSSAWSNPTNALTDNNLYASSTGVAQDKGGALPSNYLLWTQFNFTNSDIPVGSIITGFEGYTKNYGATADYTGDYSVYLWFNGSPVGSNMLSSVLYPSTPTYRTYGSSTNMWGTTFTRTHILNSTFGISLMSAGNGAWYVDFFAIRVYYIPGHTSVVQTNNWNNVMDAKVSDGGQIKPVQNGWVVVNGVWQKWWPPPSTS